VSETTDRRERLERMPVVLTYEEVRQISVRLERLDTKMDQMADLAGGIASLMERVRSLELAEARSAQRTDSWYWLRDAILAIAIAVVGAGVWFS
jgi:hypothetical protein